MAPLNVKLKSYLQFTYANVNNPDGVVSGAALIATFEDVSNSVTCCLLVNPLPVTVIPKPIPAIGNALVDVNASTVPALPTGLYDSVIAVAVSAEYDIL